MVILGFLLITLAIFIVILLLSEIWDGVGCFMMHVCMSILFIESFAIGFYLILKSLT